MRTRIFTLILSLFIATMAFAEDVAISVHVSTPGTLAQEIINAGSRPALVTKLTVTGTLNDDDYKTMRETASLLYDINLSGVTDTYMPERAFRRKSILQSIVLPENLTSIGDGAFDGCSSLTSITIPNSVTEIGVSAFGGCYALTSIEIPNSVTKIGMNAFTNCGATSIEIPNSVTEIGEYAFCNSALTSIKIPNSVTEIGNQAFSDCHLTDITCYAGVPPTCGNDVFSSEVYSSATLTVPEVSKNDYLITSPWDAFLNIETMDVTYYQLSVTSSNENMGSVSETKKYYTPNEVVEIYAEPYNGYKFTGWSDGNTDNPRTITMTGNLTLTANFVVRPYEVTLTCNEAQGSVTGGGEYEPGTQVTITATAKDGYQFSYWNVWYDNWNYNSVYENPYTFEMGSQYYNIEAVFEKGKVLVDGLYYYLNDDNTATVTSPNGDEYSGDVVIPETIKVGGNTYTVTTIDNYAFVNTSITSLTVPNNVYPEGGQIVNNCDNLKTIKAHADFIEYISEFINDSKSIKELYYTGGYISEYVTRIATLEVIDMSAIENTELWHGMFAEEVDLNGYYDFTNLRKLILPNGLTSIKERQFENLRMLEEIVIPNGVTEIPNSAFYDCHALSKVTLNENLTSIGNYAFYSCHALEDIVIPEGVSEIGNAAFYACTYLENIELPSTMQVVGDNAFALCNKVKRMEVKAVTPPAIEAKTFYEVSREIEFIVPDVAREAYAEHEYWKEFIQKAPNSVEDNESVELVVYSQNGMLYIEGITSDYRLFDATGKLIYTGRDTQLSLPNGIYLLNVDNKTYKVAM